MARSHRSRHSFRALAEERLHRLPLGLAPLSGAGKGLPRVRMPWHIDKSDSITNEPTVVNLNTDKTLNWWK
jgi:hypothetical protein